MNERNTILLLVFLTLLYLTAAIVLNTDKIYSPSNNLNKKVSSSSGVCPPFNLYDIDGKLIDPVNNINQDKPYSSRQTCGKCHDYDKITAGFHFQQGKGEKPTEEMSERYQWVTSPGVYGGTWCSPAPLYRKLAFKKNINAKEIDMTSFEYITATCGYCHPGGGSLEFDRDGIRYDLKMNDSSNKMVSWGDNGFDGDYYKAGWDKTGVIEADCMLCHLPEYDYKKRNSMIDSLNFKWAATEGSGLGKIIGSVKSQDSVQVNYDLSKFGKDGKVSLHLVREPRNETCLNCHAKPDWKKRGTDYSSRRDVHIAAGLKCIDCHPSGSSSPNTLINGKEEHNFGKGDDPGGFVRNDLDNTVRSCENCHIEGYLNAPIAKHSWLPPIHFEKIACQTCHIPVRSVKSAMIQVSDVYNNGPKISPPAKHIWTFYDQNMKYWNHYGELNMFTPKDMPTDESIPVYANYKGKIFPVNSVHSSWPGILTSGKPGLDQPKMKDVYGMWVEHFKDSSKYPLLSKIKDDNGDEIPEVNTEVEIDAIINSVATRLNDLKYNMNGKSVVWVNNDLVYTDGNNFTVMDKHNYESSPYASVYKFSHNVFPSQSALGINGCTDCHSGNSGFFTASVVKYPFSNNGYPLYEQQYTKMGLSASQVYMGIFREEFLKLLFYSFLVLMAISFTILVIFRFGKANHLISFTSSKKVTLLFLLYTFFILGCVILIFKPGILEFILPSRFVLDSNHFLLSVLNTVFSLLALNSLSKLKNKTKFDLFAVKSVLIILSITLISGFLMLLQTAIIYSVTVYAYTIFDITQVLLSMFVIIVNFKFIQKNIYTSQKVSIN